MADIALLIRDRAQLVDRIATITAARDSQRRALDRARSDLQFAVNDRERARFQQQIDRLEPLVRSQTTEIERLTAELDRVNREISRLQQTAEQQARRADTAVIATGERFVAQFDAATDSWAVYDSVTRTLVRTGLASQQAAQQAARALNQQSGTGAAPPVSSGDQVRTAQRANDEGADTSTPTPGPERLDGRGVPQDIPTATVPSNAARTTQPSSSGLANPVNPSSQNQSTPARGAQPTLAPGSDSAGVTVPATVSDDRSGPTLNPGTAAPGDDNSNGVVARIQDVFGGQLARIVPQGNVLDRASSYTYNFSLYLTDPSLYRSLAANARPSLQGSNLLLQSGGAPTGQRNQEFPLDFYIDDVSIKSALSGKASGGAHNAVELSFKIYEPSGITFLDRLARAVRGFSGDTNDYAAQAYLLVIRFWGYDENGELVRTANAVTTPGAAQEPGLIVEKYIPFRFRSIKFRLANKVAEYDCQASALRDYAAPSQTRGIIPYNIELTSVTLRELLVGNLAFGTANQTRDTQGRPTSDAAAPSTATNSAPTATTAGGFNTGVTFENQVGAEFGAYFDQPGAAVDAAASGTVTAVSNSQTPAPPKADSAPRPVLIRGLTAALNEFQAQLVKNGTQEFADVYEIVINEAILRDALLQPPEAAAGLRSVPMTTAQTAGAQKLGIKQSVDRDTKNVAAVAGMSIIQFLDQTVRNSSYILDQQTKIYRKNPATGVWYIEPRSSGNRVFAWYRIGMDSIPIKTRGRDRKRGDYPYRITYTISPYLVNLSQSAWFPASQFQGTHKKYQYWFTGLNTSIINYEQQYDYLYYLSISGGQDLPGNAAADYREYEQRAFQARAPESSQGAPGPLFDPSAQAAAALYSPGDTARIKMTIMGDPAWIQQGEIVSGVAELGSVFYGPFLPDGTINYDSREPLFEVTFNTASDYDLDTGLMSVNRRAS
jgi:hypothetical protein